MSNLNKYLEMVELSNNKGQSIQSKIRKLYPGLIYGAAKAITFKDNTIIILTHKIADDKKQNVAKDLNKILKQLGINATLNKIEDEERTWDAGNVQKLNKYIFNIN